MRKEEIMNIHYGFHEADDVGIIEAPKPAAYVCFATQPDAIVDTDTPGVEIAKEMSEVTA